MKILLISPKMERPNGGIAIWTEMYLEGCAKADVSCTVVNTAPIGKRALNGSAGRSASDELVRTRKIFQDLKKSLKERYDAVHLNTSCGTFGVIRDYLIAKKIRRKLPKTKLVVHFHCDIPFQVRNKISKRYLAKLVSLCDDKLVLCENSRKYLLKNFHVESEMVPNFINEAVILDTPKPIAETLRTAFFVGRVSRAKGAEEMFALAKRLPNVSFRLAGAIPEEVATWEKPDNLYLLGPLPHDEVFAEMDQADLFIFPSHSEGFSVALMEAMARGLPTIATNVGAAENMLEDRGGIIVDVGDVDAMVRAFDSMQTRPSREHASLWVWEKVKQNYTTESVMALLKRIYGV